MKLELEKRKFLHILNIKEIKKHFPSKKRREKFKNKRKDLKNCGERGSNTRPSDLQSDALPTELSPLADICNSCIYKPSS